MYFLLPLSKQTDYGFGFTAGQFMDAAKLVIEKDTSDDLSMPINYLLRHSIELYLKSFIIILTKFKDLGDVGGVFDVNSICIGKVTISNCHNISVLYNEFKVILSLVKKGLPSKGDWDIPGEVERYVNLINGYDSKSDLFRYPITNNINADEKKNKVRTISADDVISAVNCDGGKPVKCFMLLGHNDDILDVYDINTKVQPDIRKALIKLGEFVYNFHAMLRFVVCKGF